MDFFDIAKNMESEAVKMYTALAAGAPLEQLKGVFTTLAHEEQGHYNLFDNLQKKIGSIPADENILKRAKSLLSKWDRNFKAPDMTSLESAYHKGLANEKEAVAFYSKEKTKLSDEKQKHVVDIIIQQEKRHVTLFENLIEFVRKPKEWLENAEFNHLDQF